MQMATTISAAPQEHQRGFVDVVSDTDDRELLKRDAALVHEKYSSMQNADLRARRRKFGAGGFVHGILDTCLVVVQPGFDLLRQRSRTMRSSQSQASFSRSDGFRRSIQFGRRLSQIEISLCVLRIQLNRLLVMVDRLLKSTRGLPAWRRDCSGCWRSRVSDAPPLPDVRGLHQDVRSAPRHCPNCSALERIGIFARPAGIARSLPPIALRPANASARFVRASE